MDDELSDSIVDGFVKQMTGDVGTTPDECCPRRSWKARGHSGSEKVDDSINVGGRTSEATREHNKKPLKRGRKKK